MVKLLGGDVNGDEIINSDDLNMIWKPMNYLKSSSEPGVESITDINGDGIVNSDDLNIIWQPTNYLKSQLDCDHNY